MVLIKMVTVANGSLFSVYNFLRVFIMICTTYSAAHKPLRWRHHERDEWCQYSQRTTYGSMMATKRNVVSNPASFARVPHVLDTPLLGISLFPFQPIQKCLRLLCAHCSCTWVYHVVGIVALFSIFLEHTVMITGLRRSIDIFFGAIYKALCLK